MRSIADRRGPPAYPLEIKSGRTAHERFFAGSRILEDPSYQNPGARVCDLWWLSIPAQGLATATQLAIH